jgi:hypothetical protein
MFTIARWFAISDQSTANGNRLKGIEAELSALRAQFDTTKGHLASHAESAESVSAALRQLVERQGAHFVVDESHIWRGLRRSIDSFNPTLLREVTIAPSGSAHYRMVLDEERVFENFYERFTDPNIRLSYLIFVPRKLGFGSHPIETLMRLFYIVRICRRRALERGEPFRETPRLFLFDAPRPLSTFFLTYRESGRRLHRIALEYVRSTEPGVLSTNTLDRSLIEHTVESEIAHLDHLYEQKVGESVEVPFSVAETIISPLLPEDDAGVAPSVTTQRLQAAAMELYARANRNVVEVITNPGHFALNERRPSLHSSPNNPPADSQLLPQAEEQPPGRVVR